MPSLTTVSSTSWLGPFKREASRKSDALRSPGFSYVSSAAAATQRSVATQMRLWIGFMRNPWLQSLSTIGIRDVSRPDPRLLLEPALSLEPLDRVQLAEPSTVLVSVSRAVGRENDIANVGETGLVLGFEISPMGSGAAGEIDPEDGKGQAPRPLHEESAAVATEAGRL